MKGGFELSSYVSREEKKTSRRREKQNRLDPNRLFDRFIKGCDFIQKMQPPKLRLEVIEMIREIVKPESCGASCLKLRIIEALLALFPDRESTIKFIAETEVPIFSQKLVPFKNDSTSRHALELTLMQTPRLENKNGKYSMPPVLRLPVLEKSKREDGYSKFKVLRKETRLGLPGNLVFTGLYREKEQPVDWKTAAAGK